MAAGAQLAVVRPQTGGMGFIGAMAVMVMVILMAVSAVAVGVVGPLVDPAVEQIGAQESDHNPAHRRKNAGLLHRVGRQVEAHHAEHHPRGKAQQEAHRPIRRAVDHRGQSAAQGQPSRAGDGGDKKNCQVNVH